jgi:hypothetical protein
LNPLFFIVTKLTILSDYIYFTLLFVGYTLHNYTDTKSVHSNVEWIFFISIPLIPYSYGVEVLCYFILWIYTQSVGLPGRVIGPSQCLYLNTGQQKHRKKHTHTHKTSMPEVGFELTITGSERAKTVHALDRMDIDN